MKHFLLTRFNLKFNKTTNESSPHIYEALTIDWLEDRFEIFEKYCLPSIKNQVNQNFRWIILFDIDTPIIFKKKAENLKNDYGNIDILFIDGFKELTVALQKHISSYLNEKDKFIITTRLDNDDLIHQDFILTIKNLAKPIDNLVLDLTKGYQLQQKDSFYTVRNYTYRFNPFISVVENVSNFETVLSKMHTDWSNATNIISFESKRLWLEFVHDKNISNRAKKYLPFTNRINFNEFRIKKTKIKLNKMQIIANNVLSFPLFVAYKFYKIIKP